MRAQAVRETRISFFSAVRRRPRPERLHHHETHDHEARASRSRESGDARDGRAALSAVFFLCVFSAHPMPTYISAIRTHVRARFVAPTPRARLAELYISSIFCYEADT